MTNSHRLSRNLPQESFRRYNRLAPLPDFHGQRKILLFAVGSFSARFPTVWNLSQDDAVLDIRVRFRVAALSPLFRRDRQERRLIRALRHEVYKYR